MTAFGRVAERKHGVLHEPRLDQIAQALDLGAGRGLQIGLHQLRRPAGRRLAVDERCIGKPGANRLDIGYREDVGDSKDHVHPSQDKANS